MRIETKTEKFPLLEPVIDNDGNVIDVIDTGKFEEIKQVHIYADEGKFFYDKVSNMKCGNYILLGTGKTENDYYEK